MSRYQFELATPADDGALRQILEATPMEGRISVVFRREPSWFAGAVVDGQMRQVLICREATTGQTVGQGCRSIRDVFINGKAAQVGYLSNLRLLPSHRRRGLLARGYRFLQQLHADGRVPYYLTTIAAGNDAAMRTLTSGRAGLPRYAPAGDYHTLAIALPRRANHVTKAHNCVRAARRDDLPRLLEFWSTHGAQRQFFPRLRADDFLTSHGIMRGLSFDWLLVFECDQQIVGTLGGWDQYAYRQTVVRAYRGALRWARPAFNVWSRLQGRSGLPRPGSSFRCLMAALPVVASDDESVFDTLVAELVRRASRGNWSHLLVGLHASDPLLLVAQRHATTSYDTHLFLAYWPDGELDVNALDGRPPYLELGSL